jgi:site-specific DNA-methyltransferase (adenine-specific)
VTPYYADDLVTIYHGDCREWIGPHADVLVTDPPYGVSFAGKATKHTARKTGGYTVSDDPDIGPTVVRAMLPHVQRGAVFTGNRTLHSYPEPRDIGCVFCPSGAGIGPWGFTLFHPVLFYGPRCSTVLRPTSIQSFATAEDEADGHPCPKPLRWMTWAVSLASVAGETVLDPFVGSGTTLVAAKATGRRAIGIEIEERYCEIAARRCSQEVLGLTA